MQMTSERCETFPKTPQHLNPVETAAESESARMKCFWNAANKPWKS